MDRCNQKEAIGRRIKEARSALGMLQKDFSARIGMPMPSLRDYELGKRIPGGEAITSFMSAGISADWLLTGDGGMLRTDGQAGAGQPASPLDTETLTYVIEGVEAALQSRRLVLDAARKAALIQLIYEYCMDTGSRKPGTVERFLKLVA